MKKFIIIETVRGKDVDNEMHQSRVSKALNDEGGKIISSGQMDMYEPKKETYVHLYWTHLIVEEKSPRKKK